MPRARLILPAALLTLASVAASCTSVEPDTDVSLSARTFVAGAVDVSIDPLALDASGARFRVDLDTHTVPLDLDLVASVRLEVDGVTWRATAWNGDGPGGHHRGGELAFRAGGPARGVVVLTLEGLPEPVEARWNLAQDR